MSSAHGNGGGHAPQILPFFSTVEGWSHGAQGIHLNFKPLVTTFIVIVVLFFIFEPQQSIYNFEFVLFFLPLFAPIVLYRATHTRFAQMTKAKFFAEQKYMLLEIKMPRDTTKTPFAMETFFANMHIGSGEATWYKRFIQGGVRPWWSFEIVSLGGRIHFYIWTRVGFRRLIESYIYAQYPDVEIIEAEDYSLLVDPSEHGYSMFAGEYTLNDKKSDAYPLKTYIDYKMEPGNKPEETVDPLGQVLETIGNIGPNEQFWMQIIIRMSKGEKYQGLQKPDGSPYTWSDEVKRAIDDLRSQTVKKTTRVDPVTGATTETESFPNPSKGLSEGIASVERKANKQIFDVGIRSIYLAPEESFQGIMIPAQISIFKPFNNNDIGNSLGLQGVWNGFFNDYPWEDRGGHHKHHLQHEAVEMYRRRAYFFPPYKGKWMHLSTEELATLYHVPSAAVTTPALERIQSSTSSAPSNLPS